MPRLIGDRDNFIIASGNPMAVPKIIDVAVRTRVNEAPCTNAGRYASQSISLMRVEPPSVQLILYFFFSAEISPLASRVAMPRLMGSIQGLPLGKAKAIPVG